MSPDVPDVIVLMASGWWFLMGIAVGAVVDTIAFGVWGLKRLRQKARERGTDA